MTLKEALYKQCVTGIENKLETIKKAIEEIQEGLQSETKSSAGDKHETGRAMLQLEREKIGNQLAEIQKTKQALEKIDITKTDEIVNLGSVIYTTKANYFIAISAGELKVNNELFYAISPATPIGILLLSKSVGDKIAFRDLTFNITKII